MGKEVFRLGYKAFKALWYRHPGAIGPSGNRRIITDKDVHQFCYDVKGYNLVHLFVEHDNEISLDAVDSDDGVAIVDRLNVICGKLIQGEKDVEKDKVIQEEVVSVEKDKVIQEEVISVVLECEKDKVVEEEPDKERVVEEEVGKDKLVVEQAEKEKLVDEEAENVVAEHVEKEKVVAEQVEKDNQVVGEEGDDESYHPNSDDSDDSSVMSLDDSDYEENWDWTTVLPHESLVDIPHDAPPPDLYELSLPVDTNDPGATYSDFEDEDGDSDDLESPSEGEGEGRARRYPRFRPAEDGDSVNFVLGQIFDSNDIFIHVVKEFALQHKKDMKIVKNDKKRVVVNCVKGCPFNLRISKTNSRHYFLLVTYEATHNCCRSASNWQAKTIFMAMKFMPLLRHSPNLSIPGLIEEARSRWGIHLGWWKAYRAKVKAIEMIHGACTDQYSHLRNYAHELLRSNPGSTVIIKSEEGPKGPVFMRIYVCLAATKQAFANTCRPLIGLDGCFLKGTYGGQLLAAVGKDGNNQMFPICYAVVEAETKDSWNWFVSLLLEDLDQIKKKKWAFISDQQKGLVPSLQELIPDVDHRLCVKHIYGNFRKKYPGSELKVALWKEIV
ncbi:uncharacterized protein LOC130725385 [Lotus japonicus]|uniref:uncharacterized protein LOC130725385 n=1 Tax=Lotus japonicus TaxID=34305 RepID=UPI002582A95C|nr:uncharacterized protein LOC130725385 [Lotus japonicus]